MKFNIPLLLAQLFFFLSFIQIDSAYSKSDRQKVRDQCKSYEKKNKNTKCKATRLKCRGQWKEIKKEKKGKFRMCVRDDCGRKCKKSMKDACKSYKKKNPNSKCKLVKAKKGCKLPWTKKSKEGDKLMCVMDKCDKACKDKKGKAAAQKICDEIKKSSGRPCKVQKAKAFRKKNKQCPKGWVFHDKIRKVKGYNAKNYVVCLKKDFKASKANSISGTSGKYDKVITDLINKQIAKNFKPKEIEKIVNKAICKANNNERKPDPRVNIQKCKKNQEPNFKIGKSTPKIIIKNAAINGQTLEFDFLVKWKTKKLKLNYKRETYCKYRNKKGKGRKKKWKCPAVRFKLNDFELSFVGKGEASMTTNGPSSAKLIADKNSFKHSARFTSCLKFPFNIKYCPAEVERTVSKVLKENIIKGIENLGI